MAKEDIMEETLNNEENLLSKEFIKFPKELAKKCTKEEFHKMMISHNSDIPIEKVNFLDYSFTKPEL